MNRPRPCRARRIAAHLAPLIALSLSAAALPACSGTGQATQANTTTPVSYTHLTLPTNREV